MNERGRQLSDGNRHGCASEEVGYEVMLQERQTVLEVSGAAEVAEIAQQNRRRRDDIEVAMEVAPTIIPLFRGCPPLFTAPRS